VADNNFADAAAYYQRIIRDFPASQYLGEASLQLGVIDVMRKRGMQAPQPDRRGSKTIGSSLQATDLSVPES